MCQCMAVWNNSFLQLSAKLDTFPESIHLNLQYIETNTAAMFHSHMEEKQDTHRPKDDRMDQIKRILHRDERCSLIWKQQFC